MSLYKMGISDKTTNAMQNSDPEIQQMMLENAIKNNETQPSNGIMDVIKELFGFGDAGASDLGAIADLRFSSVPPNMGANLRYVDDPSTKSGRRLVSTAPNIEYPQNFQQRYGPDVDINFDPEVNMGATGTVPGGGVYVPRGDGIMGLDLEQQAIDPFAEGTLKQPTGIKDIFEKIRSFTPVGMLQNLFNTSGPNYQLHSPGTRIRNGIVSIDGVNTPYNAFGGDFFDPATGLNRFDRAALRGDIFGSSRTLKEYLDKKRQISDARKIANTPGDNNPDGSGGYTGGFDSSTNNYNDPYSPGDTE